MENGIDHGSQPQDEDIRQTTVPMISVRDVTVSFGRQTVLDKLSLEIYRGRFSVLSVLPVRVSPF